MARTSSFSMRWLKCHLSIGIFVVYIDTGSPVPNIPSKSRDLADEKNKILTEWKWFETTVLHCATSTFRGCQHHQRKTICLYVYISDIRQIMGYRTPVFIQPFPWGLCFFLSWGSNVKTPLIDWNLCCVHWYRKSSA
jgi:hypothetical protein